MKYLLLLLPLLLLVSCQTKETRAQITEVQATTVTCWTKALEYQKAQLASAPKLEGDMAKVVYLMMTEKTKNDAFASCDRLMISLLGYHQARYMKNMSVGQNVAMFGLGALAIDSILGRYANTGGTSGDTWTVNGSRITSKSGNASGGGSANASSSGDGLGQANSFNRTGGNSQGISGFQPRSNPVQTDNIDANNPQSASGTNETAAPREGDAPEIPIEIPVELPIEE